MSIPTGSLPLPMASRRTIGRPALAAATQSLGADNQNSSTIGTRGRAKGNLRLAPDSSSPAPVATRLPFLCRGRQMARYWRRAEPYPPGEAASGFLLGQTSHGPPTKVRGGYGGPQARRDCGKRRGSRGGVNRQGCRWKTGARAPHDRRADRVGSPSGRHLRKPVEKRWSAHGSGVSARRHRRTSRDATARRVRRLSRTV